MKLLSEYSTAESTETQRGESGSAWDPHSTPVVSGLSFNWSSAYPDPHNTVQALAEINPTENLADLLTEPDWAATALRSGAWDFWKADEEDVYGPEDRQPLNVTVEAADERLPLGSPALILQALREMPKVTPQDVDELERQIAAGRLPMRSGGVFDVDP